MRLNELPLECQGIIDHVAPATPADPIARRLEEFGFVPGEPVKVVAFGPFGGDPMAVEIGFTRFALRRSEAARVVMQAPQDSAQTLKMLDPALHTAPPSPTEQA
ncbi:FeoA family protein [Acetobacter malorum]|uniref:FeoA family protein n=1 Tax=Acetobacter malorum TaxID=178901 RepID=UPI0039E7C9F7